MSPYHACRVRSDDYLSAIVLCPLIYGDLCGRFSFTYAAPYDSIHGLTMALRTGTRETRMPLLHSVAVRFEALRCVGWSVLTRNKLLGRNTRNNLRAGTSVGGMFHKQLQGLGITALPCFFHISNTRPKTPVHKCF